MTRMQKGLPVSSFIHVDSGAEPTGDVLHMHATCVPLWIFFESLTYVFTSDGSSSSNGKEMDNWKKYVFKDLDKILITDGNGDLNEQLNSITNFAANH